MPAIQHLQVQLLWTVMAHEFWSNTATQPCICMWVQAHLMQTKRTQDAINWALSISSLSEALPEQLHRVLYAKVGGCSGGPCACI